MAAQYIFQMQGLTKAYPGGKKVFENIWLSFYPGAKIGVLGLNGSGKSTLLRIMAGEDGEFDGEAVPMPNMRIGFLPQEPALDAAKSVRETVEEGLSEILDAKVKLDAIYAAYAEPDADFDRLAAEQACRVNAQRKLAVDPGLGAVCNDRFSVTVEPRAFHGEPTDPSAARETA